MGPTGRTPWSTGPPLVRRADPDDDPRLSLVSLAVTVGCVVAVRSWQFAVVLMGALSLHEAAHRLVARRHGASVGWPVFLPAPVFVGTLGALLPVRSWPRSRAALLEVGAAGPLAGFAVAFAVFLARWPAPGATDTLPAPLCWRLLSRGPLPADDPWLHGAWAVCLVTGMNLLPIGQLDGGHVATAALGRSARAVGWVTGAAVVALGLAWPWWWPWFAVLGLLGGWRRVPVADEPLPLRARLAAVAAAAVGVACFLPVPW